MATREEVIGSRDVRIGDVIVGRDGVPEWRSVVVLAVRRYSDLLSLDLVWPEDGKIMNACSLGIDERFTVRRWFVSATDR